MTNNRNNISKLSKLGISVAAALMIAVVAQPITALAASSNVPSSNNRQSVSRQGGMQQGGNQQNGNQPGGMQQGGMPGGMPGGDMNGTAEYNGANTITSDTTVENENYASTTDEQNALLVSDGTSTVSNISVTKTGNPEGHADNYDFYGTNAAVLVENGTLNINGGTVNTDASYANGIFAYGTGTVNVTDTTVNTGSNNSGGLMVTGGGTLTANNVTVNTKGNSSAAIRSDRGGGTLTVNGGSYTTDGKGSPVIYSTADITVNNADLTATSSEGVVVEGANSVTLNGVTLTDTNNSLNGQSETYKNIFLYQWQSGDASVGTSHFTATDSTITTNKGDTIYVTNTTSVIDLSGNTIVNKDSSGAFLRAESAAWGSSGSNGGKVRLNMTSQSVSGDVVLDDISTLSWQMSSNSSYTGTINGSNKAKSVTLTLDSSSVLNLTGDSYVTSLSNADSTNSNIHLNGYTLYVNGVAFNASTAYTDAIDEDLSAFENTQSNDGQAPNGQAPNDQASDGQTPQGGETNGVRSIGDFFRRIFRKFGWF